MAATTQVRLLVGTIAFHCTAFIEPQREEICRLFGLVAWFSIRARKVLGPVPGIAHAGSCMLEGHLPEPQVSLHDPDCSLFRNGQKTMYKRRH